MLNPISPKGEIRFFGILDMEELGLLEIFTLRCTNSVKVESQFLGTCKILSVISKVSLRLSYSY